MIRALAVGCAVAHPVLVGLFIAGGSASVSLVPRGSQQVALPARSPIPRGSLASSALSPSPREKGTVKTAQNTGRWSSHQTFPSITSSSWGWV